MAILTDLALHGHVEWKEKEREAKEDLDGQCQEES